MKLFYALLAIASVISTSITITTIVRKKNKARKSVGKALNAMIESGNYKVGPDIFADDYEEEPILDENTTKEDLAALIKARLASGNYVTITLPGFA